MQHHTDLQWLDTPLEKLKLYLDDLKSYLPYWERQYQSAKSRSQDLERLLGYAKPRIDDVKSHFRGLEPRVRTLRSFSQKLLVIGLAILFVVSWTIFLRGGASSSASGTPETDNSPFNATLGFQQIYALALPERSDRVQPLLDAANATNINITVLDAVRDKQIPEPDWPKGWSDNPAKKVGELGCLMSHVRTWKKMIAENIETALIMESDADWDLRIKEVMQGVASASKRLVDWPFDAPSRPGIFPYGDKWDVIWIGHCGSFNHDNHRIYSFNDSSVPPEEHEYTFSNKPNDVQHRPGTRSVYPLKNTICSTAYAISNAGAVKMDKEFGTGSDNIDLRLAGVCSDNYDVTCLGVWPQVITAAVTQTNIEHPLGEIVTGDAEVTDWSPGPALQYSARLNAQKVFRGSPMEKWEPRWDSTWALKNETWTQMSFREAKELEAKAKAEEEEEKEKSRFWQWYSGKYTGTRSFG